MQSRVIGIDLAKSVFHLVGMNQHGKIAARKRLPHLTMGVRVTLLVFRNQCRLGCRVVQ